MFYIVFTPQFIVLTFTFKITGDFMMYNFHVTTSIF